VRSSIHSVPSTPTGSVCGDIHSGSLTRGLWSEQEHEQFLEAMKLFPKGPWRSIAAFIGTRSIKQVQTHAQKYQQKINRRQRGLRKQKKKFVRPEHRVDVHASGCIIRTKGSQDSPRSLSDVLVRTHSRKSYARMLADATCATPELIDSENSDDEIDLAELLEGLEPFPFTDVTCEELFALDDRYQQDLQESVNLLLA
jgi:SHAQKYF class myb-like DNA-binding protein